MRMRKRLVAVIAIAAVRETKLQDFCLTSSDSDRLFIAQGDKDITYQKRINIQKPTALPTAYQTKK